MHKKKYKLITDSFLDNFLIKLEFPFPAKNTAMLTILLCKAGISSKEYA